MVPFFAINVYQNEAQATALSAKLKALYPESQISLISDEGPSHLKTADKAGQWTERWLKAFIAQLAPQANVCIKVDPDVAAVKAVTEFPVADIFGPLMIFPDGASLVYGIAMGITRQAAQKILDSGLLRDAKYTAEGFTYVNSRGVRVSCQDLITADIIRRLNLKVAEWQDVHAHAKQPPRNPEQYAFINELLI
jgi:hypothetical protein